MKQQNENSNYDIPADNDNHVEENNTTQNILPVKSQPTPLKQ
jgi:hypothetical protein